MARPSASHRSLRVVLAVAGTVAACATEPRPAAPLSAAELRNVPAATYALAPGEAELSFAVHPLGVGRIEGRFDRFDASLVIVDPVAGHAHLEAIVVTDSLHLDREGLIEMVEGEGWFDVATYPTAHFAGSIEGWEREVTGEMVGEMAIRDIARPASIAVRLTCEGVILPCPAEAVGFEGAWTVDRTAFGMTRMRGFVGKDVDLRVAGTLRVADEAP